MLYNEKFNAKMAALARDEAIDRVARKEWIEKALEHVRLLAEKVPEFTTDRLEYELDLSGVEAPKEKRIFGALMRTARIRGLVEPTDRTSLSVLVSNHRRPKRVWRSKLWIDPYS